ncbi:OmpA family protein, partial [Pseudomonas syringae]
PKVTQAWLDDYEPRLRTAIKDSNLQLERRENVLVVTAPVEGSFNPDRPAMLLPVTLGPFTRVAKILEADPKTAVLVLGHSD